MFSVFIVVLLLLVLGLAFWSRNYVESDEWPNEDYSVDK